MTLLLIQARRPTQRLELSGSQIPPLAGLQPLQIECSHRGSLQLLDGETQSGEHSANLTIPALAQDQFHSCSIPIPSENLEPFCGSPLGGPSIGEEDASSKSGYVGFLHATLHDDLVGPGDLVGRMGQFLGQLVVIRQ